MILLTFYIGFCLWSYANESETPMSDTEREALVNRSSQYLLSEVEIEIEAKEFATVEKFDEVVASLEGKISFLTEQFAKVVSALEKQGEAFSKTVDLVEKVANLPSEAPMNVDQTKVSKKDQQFENIKRFAQQLKK